MNMKNVTILDHPLIQHKISLLRNKNTGTNEFRSLTDEIAMLMGYEALRDLPLEDQEVETPIETCSTPMLAGKKLAVVPILRAGLGMVNGILALVPSAKVGHIGLYTLSLHDALPILSRTNTTASCQPRSNCVPSLSPTRCWQPAVPQWRQSTLSKHAAERTSNSWQSSLLRKD